MSNREALVRRAAPAGSLPVWRSVEEKKMSAEARAAAAQVETGVQVETLVALGGKATAPAPSLALGRRGFLVASGAAAAAGIAGCARRPAEEILPYTRTPEFSLPGIPVHFATVLSHNGEALGVIVEQHEGRPTKIEGNPAHPASNPGGESAWGSTDLQTQAAILGLYDEDRIGTPMRKEGESRSESSWEDLDEALAAIVERAGGRGEGLRFLSAPITSPTLVRLKSALLARYPAARFHTWSAVSDANVKEGVRIAWGDRGQPIVDYARAQVILSLDCDFLGVEPGAVRSARLFAAGRRLRDAHGEMNRLYAVEGTTSITGQNADQRLRIPSSDVERYAHVLARALAERGVDLGPVLGALGSEAPEGVSEAWVAGVAQDLVEHSGSAVVVVGSRQRPALHALAHAINAGLRAFGPIIDVVAPLDEDENEPVADLRALVDDMSAGSVGTLVMLGGNPVYDAPSDLGFADALARVETSIHLASHDDETSALSTWHVPMAHELESWGDHRSLDGTIAIQQPLIAPLRGGRNAIDLLARLCGEERWRAYDQVRQTFVDRVGSAGFDRAWRQALHRGVIAGVRPRLLDRSMGVELGDVAAALGTAAPAGEGWEVNFVPDLKAWDGSVINNPWLLELPDPITKATWDNAALISPASAEELGVTNGRMLRISRGERSIEIPACVAPGHADRSVTLTLGWGRTRAGRFASGCGTDVGPLRETSALHFARGFDVAATGAAGTLVITQEHHSLDTDPWIPGYGTFDMPERPAAIVGTLEEYRERPDFAQWREPTPSVGPLWTEVDYGSPHPPAVGGASYSLVPEGRTAPEGAPPRHAWGLVVDLTTCTGCSACVIACNAENNVPTVGREQVAIGREMHWLRIDRYFVGADTANPYVAFQPVGCQHCEEAPCENVCPVNATEHSPEGINEMAYNRCIGTRYCMNNCPYKVRRFNYLAYQRDPTDLMRMQFNPNVSVRMRGVMEKCNYCVQRIQASRIAARNAHARGHGDGRIADGAVVPACAQACPSEALVFGDLNDPESRVAQAAGTDRHYKLLANVGAQPRTTYLARVRNPNPEVA